jgi:uncharacterized protein YfbU (UPF0304 family)
MPNQLRRMRERRNISQAELARRVGVSRQALNAIEANRQDPSLELALKLANTLDLPPHTVFYIEESKMSPVQSTSLTKIERLQLINQYRLLQAAHSDDEYVCNHYKRLEAIFECGYVELYGEAIGELRDELPIEISDEVFDILNLHRAMLWSLGQKPAPEDVERVKFLGFDANNEGRHLGFAKFFTSDGDKYRELYIFNSHHPTLERYRKMVAEWQRMKKNPHLSKEQIDSILEAGRYD